MLSVVTLKTDAAAIESFICPCLVFSIKSVAATTADFPIEKPYPTRIGPWIEKCARFFSGKSAIVDPDRMVGHCLPASPLLRF